MIVLCTVRLVEHVSCCFIAVFLAIHGLFSDGMCCEYLFKVKVNDYTLLIDIMDV